MRWLYHLLDASVPVEDPYQPWSFAEEGFVHASFRPAVRASARLYFPAHVTLGILQIDPRRVRYEVVDTPRGPMPHILQPIPTHAILARLTLEEIDAAPDEAIDDRG